MTDAELFSRRIADHAESAMRNSVEYTGFLSEDEQDDCRRVRLVHVETFADTEKTRCRLFV